MQSPGSQTAEDRLRETVASAKQRYKAAKEMFDQRFDEVSAPSPPISYDDRELFRVTREFTLATAEYRVALEKLCEFIIGRRTGGG